ncbi:FadR family transcriptional regulator [Arenibacterium halophilum]|uniref:FadR family transcriptional regulator n=1 Tax=Arenibacterium halophilum TaxID=2583821 RepID=A0ABY2WZD1_9RHOB|nr:FadR family transcriptional regulator [Arenibacterium halophilum]
MYARAAVCGKDDPVSDSRPSRRATKTPNAVREGLQPVRNRSLGDEVYEALEKLILMGELERGVRLPSEGDLCSRFEVSRPVVRRALERLREKGLIQSRKGSGSFVSISAIDTPAVAGPEEQLSSILGALEFRLSVEPEAAYYAAIRRSDDNLATIASALEDFRQLSVGSARSRVDIAFHRAIAQGARNDHYVRALDVISYDIDLGVTIARHLSQLGQAERHTAIFAEHERIYLAIKAQDPSAARAAMVEHLERSRLRVTARGQEVVRRSKTAD